MKTFLSDIFPRLQRYGEKLDNLTLLTNQHWVLIDNINHSKTIYIFRDNGDLILSVDGKVDKGSWAYLGNNSLLVEKSDGSYLFKHGFFDENVLALKVDNSNEYVVMVNENKFKGEVKSMDMITEFLERKYLLGADRNGNYTATIAMSNGDIEIAAGLRVLYFLLLCAILIALAIIFSH